MHDYNKFITEMELFYNKLRDTSRVVAEGTKPNPAIWKRQGGYIAAFRHPASVTEPLADFSEKISRNVGMLTYDGSNAHTTVVTYGIAPDFSPDENVLSDFSLGVMSAYRQLSRPSIDYDRPWFFNQDTILVPGSSDESFYNDASHIEEGCKEYRLQTGPPFSAHITAGMFTEEISGEELERRSFFELMKEAPVLGSSRPEFIDIGYFMLHPEEFRLEMCVRINLNKRSF